MVVEEVGVAVAGSFAMIERAVRQITRWRRRWGTTLIRRLRAA
jgi:hypothetical protein